MSKLYLKNSWQAFIFVTFLLPVHSTLASNDTVEQSLRGALSATLDNRPTATLKILHAGLQSEPKARTLNMIHADLLMAYAHQKPLMAYSQLQTKERLRGLQQEMLARFTYTPPPANTLPQNILRLSRLHQYALLLDAKKSRLYLFQNVDGMPQQIDSIYTSIGKQGMNKEQQGDNKTPTGIYRITSFLTDRQLMELYGNGAFPINYPNSYDRLLERDGSGIWLHGSPRTLLSRPPQDSRGCIIVDNKVITELRKYIEVGRTPMILANSVHWLSQEQWQSQQDILYAAVMQWKKDWESMDVDKYLAHYARSYRSKDTNYIQMLVRTKHNAKRKKYIRLGLKNLDLFINPHNPDLAEAVFDQDYQSNNYNVRYRKQQLWEKQAGVWKIIYEGEN